MHPIKRRDFLYALPGLFALPALPLRPSLSEPVLRSTREGCWLSVCVPIVIEDPAKNLHTDIILISDSFGGIQGYNDKANSADYEIYLHDFAGNALPIDGAKKILRVTVPAMHTTLIKCSDLVGKRDSFWGGMKIRVRAKGKEITHASDLFSTAYVRWNFADSFDTLHAHPDPIQFQAPGRFFSSMPFPSLEEYACTLSVFNPYDTPSAGRILVHAADGRKSIQQPYRLPPHGSSLFNLNAGSSTTDLGKLFTRGSAPRKEIVKGGSILIENDRTTVKNFAYMSIRGKANNAFAAEHTIHQSDYEVVRGASPFGADGAFKPRGWLWSSFIFNGKTIGGLNLSSRVYFSSGRPLEEEMWLLAYATDGEGNLHWATTADQELASLLPAGFCRQGAIRLSPFQSCELDFTKLSLRSDFAGGMGVATSPPTSHVLMKVEVRVHNWSTSAFSHFRPGAAGARALQRIPERGGLASDYVVTGALVKKAPEGMSADSLIAILNIERDKLGEPSLEVFDNSGFVTRKRLEDLPGWACRHFMLSEFLPELSARGGSPLTLRLIDSKAVVVMSAMHIDYNRRDIAMDHGSDRFSTFLDYGCQ